MMSELPVNRENIQTITATLDAYITELEQCLLKEEWALLSEVLDRRQGYFESLFEQGDSGDTVCLKEKIKHMLEQDQVMVTKIMLQKDKVEQERLALIRSRNAVKAYQ